MITKKQKQELINNYIRDFHNLDECIGFVDGIDAVLGLLDQLFDYGIYTNLPEAHYLQTKAKELNKKEFYKWWLKNVDNIK